MPAIPPGTYRSAGPNPSVETQTAIPDTAPGNDLAQSKYDFRYTVFPETLGMDDVGHYMVININVPTKGFPKTDGLQLGEPAGNFTNLFTPLNQVSKLDTLRYGGQGFGGGNRPLVSIPRNTRRIAESIALYMPTPLIYNTNNIYEEISLTALAGKVGAGAVTVAANALSVAAAPFSAATASIASAIAQGASKVFDGLGSVIGGATSIMQNPINPAVEILFANVAQRQFAFELLLAPRNERESIAIKNIVKSLRFHAAPEINTGAGGLGVGFTWIPPADFDITFFNKGAENLNILRINTCVLERVEVDYAPASGVYSTFRNGHPVAVRLSLGFRELEPLHKQRILQGF